MFDLPFTGERQVGTSLSQIRLDHVHRYLFAASQIPLGARVLDCACGIGYGTNILASTGARHVLGVDVSDEAIAFADRHWLTTGTVFLAGDAEHLPDLGEFDAAVSFETIEHLDEPEAMIRSIRAKTLIASVPNEAALPFDPARFPHHRRHYRVDDLPELVRPFQLRSVYGQTGRESQVGEFVPHVRTIVFVADMEE